MRSLLFVLLATGAIAAPLSFDKDIPPRCDKKSNRFHHLKEFPYNYEGETISSVAGASSARSGLKIRARCVVKAVAPCQHVLKLDTVELWEAQSKNPGPLKYHVSRGSTAFAEELEAQDLVFRTDRGRVTEILAHPKDPAHVLNIKRGILSALQVQFVDEQATLEEDDVVGKCKVHYAIKSRHISGRPKVIYKTRNLTECTDRAQTDIGIHVHSYEEKPLSLLNSQSTCKLYLTAKKRTQKVVCEEQHVFRPFSAGYKNTSGAVTNTRQVLELQSIKHAEPVPVAIEGFQSVSLRYAHSRPQSNEEAIRDAYYLISRLSQETRKSTKPESAQHFSGLVFSIRKLNTPAMENLWQKVHQEEDEQMHEYLYDALPHCGTGGCAKVMSYAIREELVSHERGNMFLAGLAMAANPTKETIEHVLELCESHPGRTAMLTLGTLIHKVCESSPQQCDDKDEESPITKAESFLKSRLGYRCEGTTSEEFENILLTLKAIGNAGRPVSAENILLKCSLNLEAPVNVSIAALEALRRLPCSKGMTEQLLQIYGEHDLDVEIRIAAYLALMKCPSPEVFRGVAEVLKNEVNNQVGSFVWSHMTNAMESTEPVHGLPQAEIMKDALNGMKLREFNLNRLRFSRAWEGSFYSDILRFGGSAQSHLIYHPSSFFPRSAMLNITVDVLGASINVLETAARFEGMEILIEQFFGDEGYFPDDRIMKMFNLKPHEERDTEERVANKRLRRKRSLGIKDDINKVEKHLTKLHRTMDNRMHHPSGAVSVKMFGNEIRLASFDDISWLNDEIDKVNVIDFLLLLAKGGKKTFSKSMMFLDAQTTVPTILGLPLKLSAKGTTVASLELAGKFDIRNMFWGKMRFDVRGHVKPSAVVDISGRMSVSAVYAEAGILVNSSLYTVTQIKGNATYSQGEILKFQIGVPEEPVQFVNVSSSLFTTLNDEKLEIEGTPRRIEPSPCLNMTRLLGLRFCGQLSLPLGYRDFESPFFPFSGPASYSISMQRTDPKLTKYQLIAERLQTEDENKYDVIATMSTPGATWERNFDTNVTLWLKEDGKLVTVSAGALGTNFGTFEATYNNNTHALNLTYSVKDAVYGYPIVFNGNFFNNTENSLSRELGIQLSASYRNYTIQQLTKLYNKSGVYGFVNNITYWPGKYLYASAELNVPKKSAHFLANHTCTKTEISFNGNLGDEENSFVFNFNNQPTKAGIELTGRHLKAQKAGVLHLFARPCNQSFTVRGSYAKSGNEKGIRFTASHDNKNRVVSWYTGIVNSTNEKSLKANATVLGSKAEAVWSYFNFTQTKGIKFNGLLLNKTIDAVWAYVNAGQEKGLRFNATGLNKTMEAAWTFLNLTTGKSLKFNASVINKTIEAVWSYVNVGKEKGLRLNALALNYTMQSSLVFRNVSHAKSIKLNATVLNKTMEAVWSYINAGKEKGLRFNLTGVNKTAEVMWSYFNFGTQRGIRFNASAINKTVDATWTFVNFTDQKSLKFKAIVLNKTVDAAWSFVNSASEKSLKFNASALNKTLDAKWTLLNLSNEKGLKFQARALNETFNATWSFLNTVSEKSLKFNASALNKTMDAKWSFLNFNNEKGLKFEASALNNTFDATWSFLNLANEKSLKFNASALNKTLDAKWSFLNLTNEKGLKFEASALNKTFDATWSFLNLANEKSLKFNASALNNTINASWSFISMKNENSLLFKANVLNKTVNATWAILNLEKGKSLMFKASVLNKTVETVFTILNLRNEKGLKFSAKALNKTINATWTFYNLTNEKGLKFKASALNKTIESAWSIVYFPKEKGIKFNMSGLNKTIEAAWTFINLTNEKLIKFNASGCNRSVEAIWSYLKTENERSVKINATTMNKTVEAVWSYTKSDDEKAIKFKAAVTNKTIEAIWSYSKKENERAIEFNASVMNKTVKASWSYIKHENDRFLKFKAAAMNKTAETILSYLTNENGRSIKFNASIMNKTIEAIWGYVMSESERYLKFKASAMNKTVEATWSYLKNEDERVIKFNASAMNKTVEAIWSYSKQENERSLKFKAAAMNRTVEAIWSYSKQHNERSLKFKAAAMNRTIEAVWSYIKNENGRSIKFNASVLNKTVEAIWSYSKSENGRSIKFKATALNKTMEAAWTLLNTDSKKGLQFNLAVMNKTASASLVYFTNPTNMGLRFNVSCCNKSFEMVSKILFEEKQKKLVVSAAYQNYTVALVGFFQNMKSQKSACLYPEYLGRSHGKICAIFTNSSIEKSMSLNMTILNRTGELKMQWFKNPIECASRVTAKFNRTTFFESWLGFFHTTELKRLHFNTTVVNKSASACLYFRNTTQKAIGFNATVLRKQIGLEGIWLNGKTVKEAVVQLFWNKTVVAKSALTLLNNTRRKMVEVRTHIGRFAAEWQTTLISQSESVKELVMIAMLRNGSQSLFSDNAKLIFSKEDKSLSLSYQHQLRLMGRSFEYGWIAAYDNYSNADNSYHEVKFSFSYSKDKTVSLTGVYRNSTEELFNALTVEYLPEKTMTHSFIWYKKSNSVKVNVEVLPKKPVTWTTSWNTEDGISINSAVEFLNKKTENWFSYSRSTGEYSGHFQICPVYPVTVRGVLVRENGLLFTTEIEAFKRTWNHKIDFKKDEQKLLISVDVLPNSPVVFDANWDTSEGLRIALDLKGFKKSLHLVSSYDKLTKTFMSGVTVFKRTFTFTEKLDFDTKTLFSTLAAFNRTIGFTGRFDWKNFVVSTFVSYQKKQAGWFLRFNPTSKNIVFNVTLTPTLSGQVVGEMPDDNRLQVTLQRKFCANVVNESRLMYVLNAEASRVSLTWNTTSVNTLVGKVQNLKTLIRNVTLKYYNLTVRRAMNLTKQLDAIVRKLEAKIRPQALKLYAQMKSYDYNGLMQNATKMAQNITQRLYNITLKALNNTLENLPIFTRNATVLYKQILGNATELYKSINLNATEAYKRFQREVLPLIVGNVTLHLKNITRDLNVWAKNVSSLVSAVTVRGEKLGDSAKRLSREVHKITADLLKKGQLKTSELIVKIREIEIRGQKLGPLFDMYMLKIKEFTCGFNASCTLKNLTIIAKNLTLSVRNMTVLNKTIEEHFKFLNTTIQQHFRQLNTTLRQHFKELHKKACLMHQTVLNFTRNLTRILPKLLRNVSIQAIHLVRNVSKEVGFIAFKVRNVTLTTYVKLLRTNRPLINLTTKAFISLKGKAYPLVLKIVQPVRKFAVELNNNVTRYLRPILKPLVPMALDVIYQLRNITIRHVPIGQAMDKAVIVSLEITSQALRSINHTLSSNISAIISFIRKHSLKKADEIVDITIQKSIQFYNFTKKVFNQSLHFNLTKHAGLLYNRSITVLNKTLQELLKLRPKEILEISVKKIEFIGRNITSEVLNVTKQVRALDLIRLVKSAWVKMDLKGKVEALELKAKWENLVQRIQALNIKERALLVKFFIGNATLKVQKELQELINISQRILNLTSNLVRMNISKDAFVKEFIAIANDSSRVFIKYGILAKNTTYNWQRKLMNASFQMAGFYKNITFNRTIQVYNFLKNHSQALYNEHHEEGLKVYNFYKDLSKKTYEELKEKAMTRVKVYRQELINEVNALVAKLRQYENMTFEEIIIKVYNFSRKHGLALYNNVTLGAIKLYRNVTIRAMKLYKNITVRGLHLYENITVRGLHLYKNISLRAIELYKNVTVRAITLYKNITTRGIQLYKNVTLRAMQLFNDTKNATLRAYNFTLVLVNRTKLLAIQYLNVTRNLTFHYFNVTRNFTLRYYNLTRSLALRYYQKYYSLGRNYTLRIYNVTRNMTLRGYNRTRMLVLRGLRYLQYLNKTIVPKIKESMLKGKVLVLSYANKTVVFVRETVHMVKVRYIENKEKTIEELYYEAYQLAERYSIEAQELLKRKYNETKIRVQVNLKVEQWKKELLKLNKTVMNITAEAIALYNQTANITSIAAKELAAILHPYVKFMHNKTVYYLVRAKNISLPLLYKASNITLLKLDETRKLLNETYLKFMSCEKVQEFIQKHQLKERYAKAEKFIKEKYAELEEYVKEMKPKVEGKMQEAIDYVNVTLPARIKERFTFIKERYNLLQKKYQRLMANPRVFIERVLKKALRYLRNATRETPIEKYLTQEMWVELIEEAKQHQLVEVGRNITNYTTSNVRLAVELASKNIKLLLEKVRNQTGLLKEKVNATLQETRGKLIEKFEDVKAMKLREIVEHEYVFKTIELAKNVTVKIQNITLEARNLTRKIVAIGKLYYKNITAKVQNYTLLLKQTFNNYTTFLRQRVQNYTRILNETIRNYTKILNETVQNYTKIIKAQVQNYTKIIKAQVQNYTNFINATVQNYTRFLNASIKNYTNILRAKVQNYTNIIKAQFKNYTLILKGHYERIYESHFLPLYRNGTALVHKYRALADRCIGRCKNDTLRAIAVARNWTMTKLNLTRVWMNQTIEKGMKYYRDELKPLYFSKVLPFYNNTLVPMYYYNYSKLLTTLKKNLTLQAISMKERAINLTRQAVNLTLHSHPYAMLCKIGKMTIRESVLEGRIMYIRAYNYTLNLTRLVVNVTLTKFNITKTCLERAINKTMVAINTTLLEAEPVIAFLNATRVEVMKTAVFIGKYSGLEDAVKERVYRSYDITKNVTMNAVSAVSNNAPVFLKTSALKAMDLVNNTIRFANRYVNRTIVYLNTTLVKVTHRLNITIRNVSVAINQTIHKTIQFAHAAFNKTISKARFSIQKVRVAINVTIDKARISLEKVRVTINKTISDFRAALPKYIQVTDGGITFVIPHPRYGNIKSLAIASVERVKNVPKEVLEVIESLKQKAITKIKSLKQDAVNKVKNLKIDLQSLKEQGLDKIKSLKEQALVKMERVKREAVDKINALKKDVLLKINTLKLKALERFGELKIKARNMTVRVKTIGKAWVAVAMNRTVLYRQKAYGFAMEVYNITKDSPIMARYIDITRRYIKITKELAVFYRQNGYAFVMNAYNLTKNHPLTRKYVNLTRHYFNITKELAVKYHQKTCRLARNYYNLTKNHPLIVKYTNMTVHYFNITKNFVRGLNLTQIKNVTEKYLVRALNLSRQYVNMTQIKNVTEKYLVRALNLSRQYVNLTQIKNITEKYLVRVLNLSRQYVNLTQIKNITEKYLVRVLNLSRQYVNLTQIKNITEKYLVRALNLSRQYLNVTQIKNITRRYLLHVQNVTYKFLNMSRQCTFYKQIRNITFKFLNMSRQCTFFNKMRNVTYKFLNLSRRCMFLSQPKNITLRYLYRALNLSRYCLNITQKYLSHALNLSRQWYAIVVNKTLNYSIQVYRIAENVTLDIYNSSCLLEAFGKATNYSKIALNVTMKFYSNYSSVALNKTLTLYKNYSIVALNKTLALYRDTLARARNLTAIAVNKTIKLYRRAYNKTMVMVYNTYNKTMVMVYNTYNKTMVMVYNTYNKTMVMVYNTYNKTMVMVYNTTLVKQYIPMMKKYVPIAINATRNFTMKAYRVVVNVTLDIYNSSCVVEAFHKTRNHSKIVFNATAKLYQVAKVHAKNFSSIALNKTLGLYQNYSRIAFNKTMIFYNRTIKLGRRLYYKTMVIVRKTTLVRKYIPMVRKYVPIAINVTRNFTVKAYRVIKNVTLDIYNSSCVVEAFYKTRNYSKIAFNATVKIYQVAVVKARNFSVIALNKTLGLYKNCSTIVLNKTIAFYNETLGLYKNYSTIVLNKTIAFYNKTLGLYKNYSTIVLNKTIAFYNKTLGLYKNYSKLALNKTIAFYNRTIKQCRRLFNKTMVIVYNTTLVKQYIPMMKKYVPIAINATRNFTVRVYRVVVNVTLDIYNSSCVVEAFHKTRNYSKIAFNTTMKFYQVAVVKAKNFSALALNKTLALYKNYSAIAFNKTIALYKNYSAIVFNRTNVLYNFSAIVFNKTTVFYQRVYNKTAPVIYNTTLVKKYLPMVFNLSRQWCSAGFNATLNLTLNVYKFAVNMTLDIRYSNSLPQALMKFRNYSVSAFNQTVKFCRKIYRQMYNATLQKYRELKNQSLALYREIAYHDTTVKCINKVRNYFDHTKRVVKMRVKNLHRAKGHLQKRINHQVNRISHLLNPVNWIPPFNSTAMIFGGPHVYTFDGTYYKFPGYNKPGCMYVLARDVRDNKFTILSQETAIIVVTDDSSVKIHQDGRVETIVKITSSGKKISDGYHSELPVEAFNTTVQREGSFILLRHDLGLEIVCDVEHYLCSFNIAKWYHGRMAGLLGTNNNEFHDEFMTSSNKLTKKLTEFVNSWEITRDPECKILSLEPEKPKCKETSYVRRCRALFKDQESPLQRYFSVVNPEPFVKACEQDYKECDSSTPKDMKHCNTTAAYIELVRLHGEWADFLPECGRCGSKPIGQRWFQRANKMVDVIVLVHETSVLKSYAEKLPTYLSSITEALDSSKYSFKFGVMAYGGRLLHERPHAITLNGQLMNDLPVLEEAFEHLKFAGEESENDTTDALEALSKAAYVYPFRPAATKIFLLLTSTERSALADAVSVDSIGKLLETKDITLNVIGKYRKFRGEIVGQDYRGKVFYRKKPEIGTGAAPLPAGEYVELMKGTQGSVFGLPFLGSENKDKFGALQQASVSTWREQIKRDQFTCKECFCARGDAGQGKTICKVNSYHQKC